MRGILRNADGVIRAAQMTVVNDHTNVVRSSMTNTLGQYAFTIKNAALSRPGGYLLSRLDQPNDDDAHQI